MSSPVYHSTVTVLLTTATQKSTATGATCSPRTAFQKIQKHLLLSHSACLPHPKRTLVLYSELYVPVLRGRQKCSKTTAVECCCSLLYFGSEEEAGREAKVKFVKATRRECSRAPLFSLFSGDLLLGRRCTVCVVVLNSRTARQRSM